MPMDPLFQPYLEDLPFNNPKEERRKSLKLPPPWEDETSELEDAYLRAQRNHFGRFPEKSPPTRPSSAGRENKP